MFEVHLQYGTVQQNGGFTLFFDLIPLYTYLFSCISVSGDGRVSNWTIVKTALWYNDTLLINFSKTLHNLGEDSITTQLRGQYREGVQGTPRAPPNGLQVSGFTDECLK